MNDEPFLVSKDGEVWACWLNGRPAVSLGSEQNFWMIAEKLFNELHPEAIIRPDDSTNQTDNSGPAASPSIEKQIERDEPRYDVTLIGRLYGSGGSREVTIFDLSTRGCRVQDRSHSKPGSLVTIKIGTVGPIEAIIRWRQEDHIGLKFVHPLYPAVLSNIRERQSLR